MNKTILVVAAHPDDEALGCGGTIALHSEAGNLVQIVFLTDGVGSRENTQTINFSERKDAAIEASKILGAAPPIFLNYPDNQMDSIPLLDVIIPLEEIIDNLKPDTVYTHFSGDLNIDHQITNQAVMTACRPQPHSSVKEIFSFEILSSTDWSANSSFNPNCFVDIKPVLDKKIASLLVYEKEIREYPHTRSMESIKALISLRGSSVGFQAAESFELNRMLISIN